MCSSLSLWSYFCRLPFAWGAAEVPGRLTGRARSECRYFFLFTAFVLRRQSCCCPFIAPHHTVCCWFVWLLGVWSLFSPKWWCSPAPPPIASLFFCRPRALEIVDGACCCLLAAHTTSSTTARGRTSHVCSVLPTTTFSSWGGRLACS